MLELKQCLESSGITFESAKETFRKIKDGEVTEAGAQKKIGCLTHCFLNQRGLWKDGNVDMSSIDEKFKVVPKREEIKSALTECVSNAKGEDDCETAFKVLSCMRGKMPLPLV